MVMRARQGCCAVRTFSDFFFFQLLFISEDFWPSDIQQVRALSSDDNTL